MAANDRFTRTISKDQLGNASQWEMRPLVAGNRIPGPASLLAHGNDAARVQSGYEAGHAKGHADAQRDAQQLRAVDLQRFEVLLTQLRGGFDELSVATADALLELALDVAAQVVRCEVQTRPDVILPVVREALGMVIDSNAHPTVRLAPADFVLVRQALKDDGRLHGCRCVEDVSIQPGGCRVESSHGDVDATLATRWRRVVQSLGCNTPPPHIPVGAESGGQGAHDAASGTEPPAAKEPGR